MSYFEGMEDKILMMLSFGLVSFLAILFKFWKITMMLPTLATYNKKQKETLNKLAMYSALIIIWAYIILS